MGVGQIGLLKMIAFVRGENVRSSSLISNVRSGGYSGTSRLSAPTAAHRDDDSRRRLEHDHFIAGIVTARSDEIIPFVLTGTSRSPVVFETVGATVLERDRVAERLCAPGWCTD
jgi:hypothetical protein